MSGMGDGYVGTAQDAVRIRRLEKQREAERRKIQELKTKSASAKGQPGLLQFGSSTSEILETAFKKETVGLVTREQYVEKRVNIQSKIEEEEKEKLQKQQQEEEELQLQKRKKRKIKGNSRLSFAEDIDNDTQEEEPHHDEPLQITYSYWDGTGHRRVIQAIQQQLAPEFREIRTTSVENLLYVKEDLIIPHQHSFYELIVNKARGKSGPLFHFDVHEDVRTIADATIEKDESHAGKVVERHCSYAGFSFYASVSWLSIFVQIYDPTKKWERYTIHGD
ncbi:XAP5 protein [Sesbania bispinosa]|nr:XAP5 protein [Sesbania bispinosa]